MARARWTALVVVAALAAGVVGCGSSEEKGTDVRKVAYVAPYGDNEPDWTLQPLEFLEEWPRRLGVRVDKLDASKADDARAVLEQAAQEGSQLVFANDSSYADAAEAVAERSRVPMLVWGERSDPVDGLVGEITVEDKEGGYEAGIVAAKAAITRRLGIVVIADGTPWELATWNRMVGGFIAGARSADPRVRLYYEQVGEDGDATEREVYDAAMRVQRRGAQMVFALGGVATVGALRAVQKLQGENQFVGVIGDKAEYRTDNFVLVSVMFDTRAIYERARRDVRAGTFGERPYALTLRNRGVWLYSTGRTPADAYDVAIRAGAKISAGRLDVPVTPTREAIETLLAGETPEG